MPKIGNIILPDFPLLLAPMEDVSDPPFRMVCKENGADLMYTEFISSEGLIRDAAKSRMKLDVGVELKFSPGFIHQAAHFLERGHDEEKQMEFIKIFYRKEEV